MYEVPVEVFHLLIISVGLKAVEPRGQFLPRERARHTFPPLSSVFHLLSHTRSLSLLTFPYSDCLCFRSLSSPLSYLFIHSSPSFRLTYLSLLLSFLSSFSLISFVIRNQNLSFTPGCLQVSIVKGGQLERVSFCVCVLHFLTHTHI